MRQTYLTSDNPTVVNRLRKDCREYARQRELEEWFENIHHVRLAWKEDADGKRTVEGVEAVMSKETLSHPRQRRFERLLAHAHERHIQAMQEQC